MAYNEYIRAYKDTINAGNYMVNRHTVSRRMVQEDGTAQSKVPEYGINTCTT